MHFYKITTQQNKNGFDAFITKNRIHWIALDTEKG